MNSADVKIVLENNFRVNKSPLLKMAIDCITDLEKENVELKEKLGDVQMQKAGEKSDLVWKLKTTNEQKIKELKELKEENIKLKERNAELAGQKASLERWFGEAKEIIRKYYNYNPSCEYSYDDIYKQSELFLKG